MSTEESVRAESADDAAVVPPRRGGARRRPRRDRTPAEPAPVLPDHQSADGSADDSADSSADDSADDGRTPVRYWHRDHPVFTPLAGFFTGVVLVVVVLLLLGAILDVVGYDVSEHPWVFLVALGVLLAANLVLVVVGGTRRFARYMLFGILTTPAVIVAVGALTFWLLIQNDS